MGPLGEGAQWRLNVTKALCDWYESRTDDRKSAAAVGATAHDDYVDAIADLVYQNNIGCWLPVP